MEIASVIRNFRKKKLWNQAELARALGIDQTSISNWEKGKEPQGFKVVRKFFENGATVEELFDIEYNKIHNLGVQEASPANSGKIPKKLNDFEADLLREMLDEFAVFDDELESFKKLREVYKLGREIELGDNTTDLTAKKQRLQELEEQIDYEIPFPYMFDAKKEIKTLEKDLEQMEEVERNNSYEKSKVRQRIRHLQKQIEKEMYSYVDEEIKKLEQKEATKEKVRKWKDQLLDRLREKIKRKAHNSIEQNTIKQRIRELEEELAGLEKGG